MVCALGREKPQDGMERATDGQAVAVTMGRPGSLRAGEAEGLETLKTQRAAEETKQEEGGASVAW